MKDALEKLLAAIQRHLPQHALTALVHKLMRSEIRWLKNMLITVISSVAGVDWLEAESMELDDYPSFNAFFTRQLQAGARPLDAGADSLICPCDGSISELGMINGDAIFQAKWQDYSLDGLLAGDASCEALRDGVFCTIYLSPRDYHRVHMPLDGELRRMTYVPGDLYSVAPYTVRQVPNLFARNERVVSIFHTQAGPMAVVLVGAMLVASMDTVWAGTITPAAERVVAVTEYADGEVTLARGDEMGRFNMGSTVILLLPPGVMRTEADLHAGDAVKMGQRLGRLTLGA